MDSDRLKYLEKRYWAGESSLEEERELRAGVKSGADGISEHLVFLFQEIETNQNQSLDADFEEEFWLKANTVTNGEARVFTLSLFMRYAAVGIILCGVTFALWNIILKNDYGQSQTTTEIAADDTFDDPEVAFEETKRALVFASQKLNKGKEPVQEIKRFYSTKLSIAGTATDSLKTK